MSSSVESRIVTMKFDNSLFERAASATMSTLDKLKMAVGGLPNSTKGLSTLADSTKRFSLGNMADEVHNVSAAFVGLATVGITALANITNRAVNAGIEIAKSFTIAPIVQGFGDYETKINAVQTILSNTSAQGTKLGDVTKALAQLNTYANKTVYNFAEMAKNIGTFTAAGVDLKTSVSSIKGIANLAAMSGSSSAQASSAMYQLSQAIAAGQVHLQDWNSVVNAGIGGAVFQKSLVRTGIAMGTISANAVKTSGPMHTLTVNGLAFRNSLTPKPGEKSWLTTDVLTKTLGQFTGDLTDAQLAAQGFSKAQIKAIQAQAKTANNAATQVKTLSQLMQALREEVATAWSNVFATLFGNINQAKKLFSPLHTTMENALTGPINSFNKVLEKWSKLGGRTKLIQGLVNIFHALGRVITPVKNAFRDIFPATTGRDLFQLTRAFVQFTRHLSISKSVMKDIRSTFGGVFAVLSIGIDVIKNVIKYFASFIGLILGGIFPAAKGILDFTGNIGDMLIKVKEFLVDGGKIDGFFNTLIKGRAALLGPLFKKIGEVIGWAFSRLSDGLTWLLDNLSKLTPYAQQVLHFIENIFNVVKDWTSLKVGAGMSWISDHKDDFQRWAESAKAFVQSGFDKVVAWLSQLKPYVQDAKDLASALADLVSSGIGNLASNLGPMLSGLGGSIASGLSGVGGAVGGLFGKIDLGSMFNMGGATDSAVSGIHKVGGELAKTMSIGDKVHAVWDAIVKSFAAVGHFLAPAVHAFGELFASIGGKIKEFFKGFTLQDVLALVNTAFFIMFYRMATQFVGTLKGLAHSASETLDAVTGSLKGMQRGVQAAAILNIAIAVGILAASLFLLSKIDPASLAKSLVAVVALVATLAMTIKVLDKTMSREGAISGGKMIGITVAMMALAGAILLMAVALKILASIDTKGLIKGVVTTFLVLDMLVRVSQSVGPKGAASMLIASFAIGVLAVSLMLLAGALKIYESLDFKTIVSGGLKAALAVAALGIALQFFPSSALSGAAALAIVAISLRILSGVLQEFSKMSWGAIVKSLTELGLVLLEIGIFLASMTEGIAGAGALLVFAFAMKILLPVLTAMGAMSWDAIWGGILKLGAVLGALAIAALLITPAIPSLLLLAIALEMLGVASLMIGGGMLLAATGIAALAAAGTAGFAVLISGITMFLQALPLMIQQFGLAMRALAKVIRTEGPIMIAAFGVVLRALLAQIRRNAPQFGKTLLVMIHTGLRVIRGAFPDFVQTGITLIMTLLRAIKANVTKITPIAISIVLKFIAAVASKMGKIAEAGVKLVIKFINSIANALRKHQDDINRAAANLGGAIVSGIAGAIRAGLSVVVNAAKALAGSALAAAKAKLHINSPSKDFIKIGMGVNEGFAKGLIDHSHLTRNAAGAVAEGALETVRVAMSKTGEAIALATLDATPRISPVLDLAHLAREATKIGGMLESHRVRANLTLDRANSISADHQAAFNASFDLADDHHATKEIKFEQHITSPKALSPVEVYRNTRNQLNQAKEALSK